MSGVDQLRAIMDRRIAIHDGSRVGKPMVPPRAPFCVVQCSAELDLPPGQARLRSRSLSAQVNVTAVSR